MAEEASEFKIAVIGESGVGKSCIVSSFSNDDDWHATEGREITTKKIEAQGKEITLQIIDTSGTANVQKSLYKEFRGIMVVYDITDRSSFECCSKWLQDIDEHCQRYPAVVVIGNKCDIEDKREVSKETLEGFAVDHGVSFMEVSGKTGKNIRETFNLLAEDILYEEEELRASQGRSECCILL